MYQRVPVLTHPYQPVSGPPQCQQLPKYALSSNTPTQGLTDQGPEGLHGIMTCKQLVGVEMVWVLLRKHARMCGSPEVPVGSAGTKSEQAC